MKLSNCNRCSLCKNRLHLSYPKGRMPANVMIIVSREPFFDVHIAIEQEFIRKLNYELKHDWYKTYVVKCATTISSNITYDEIKKCRIWLKSEIDKVKPYLIILLGNISATAVLGNKYKGLVQNIFYCKNDRKYFIGESIFGDSEKMERNLKVLSKFIQKYYR